MALKGNLRDFSLHQLLNLISLSRKTGALTVDGLGNDPAARLYFREGKLIDASLAGQQLNLAELLAKLGKISSEQAALVRQRARLRSDKEMGLLLIQSGFISQSDIISGVRTHLLDTVFQLFTWPDGAFRFEPNQLPAPERITVPVPLDNVIIEGSRRVQESERLREELPDLEVPLKFTDRPQANLRNISLSVEEWKVVSFINSRNTVKQIAEYLKLDEYHIRRVVYGLRSAGLIEFAMPVDVPKPPPLPVQPAPAAKLSRGVLLRIIDGIRRR